jgi:hypothetical protein
MLSPEEPKSAPVYAQFATVSSYIMPYEADIVRSLLDFEGVSSFLMDHHTIYLNWMYSNALGGVKVRVRRDDLESAQKIIQGALQSGKDQAVDFSEGACPVCRSMKTTPVVRGRRWSVLTWLILECRWSGRG